MRPNLSNDVEGTKFFSTYLNNLGFHDVTTTEKHCAWDIEATWGGIKCYFELKVRPKVAIDGRYNDTICELYKIKSSPDIKHHYIVNLFRDRFSVIPFTTTYEIQHKFCQKTNNWDNRKVEKDLCSFKNEEKYLYNYA